MNYVIDIAGDTDRGCDRPTNEDAYAIDEEYGVAVVADGVASRPDGAVAARLAVDAVVTYLRTEATGPEAFDQFSPELDEPSRRIGGAVTFAHERLRAYNVEKGYGTFGAATTIVVGLWHEFELYVAHVGDSRCYQARGNDLRRLTEDHRSGPSVLTRALGSRRDLRVDVRRVDLLPGDVILLATDGLNVVEDAILPTVGGPATAREIADTLIRIANSRGGPDNIAVVVARWHAPRGK
jgi:serine/threonine protein phosphatase PrpC